MPRGTLCLLPRGCSRESPPLLLFACALPNNFRFPRPLFEMLEFLPGGRFGPGTQCSHQAAILAL